MSSFSQLVPFQPPAHDVVRALTVRVGRTAGGLLQIHYRLEADMARIRVLAPREPRQVDELWKHTCFEAFVASGDDGSYRELNFAPSTEWAAYSFTGYRAGMAPISMPPPAVRVETAPGTLELSARVDLRAVFASTDVANAKVSIAIAAVLEDDAGAITYWALRHAPGRPDFHHPAGFILEV